MRTESPWVTCFLVAANPMRTRLSQSAQLPLKRQSGYTLIPMDIASLNENFGIPGVLAFEEHGELTRAVITTPSASASVYLQGGHVAEWQPAGTAPVLFTSGNSAYKKGKAIRGGIPVIFPWFGDRHDGQPGPAHGFARTEEWEFGFAALAGDDLHMSLLLAPNETSRKLGFDHFRVVFHLVIGRELHLKLTVASDGETPLVYEEAFHTYFAVGDVRETSVTGLHNVEYLDKRDGGSQKTQVEDPLVLTPRYGPRVSGYAGDVRDRRQGQQAEDQRSQDELFDDDRMESVDGADSEDGRHGAGRLGGDALHRERQCGRFQHHPGAWRGASHELRHLG